MIKGAIFDVDGTLLDSMEIWEDVGVRYLNSIGIEAEPDLGTVLFTMSIQEGAAYVKEHYHLSQEPEEIEQGVLDIISNYYKKTALLKSGAKELLENTTMKNYEIAEKVGFADPHYFGISFKKMTGCTPTEYAREKRR